MPVAPEAAAVAVAGTAAGAALHRAGRTNALFGMASDGGTRADLLSGPDVVRLVDAVAAWLGTAQRRVAASMVVLGYSARLVGPSVAVLLRDGILLDVRPARVCYAYRPESGFQLSLPDPGGWRGLPPVLREQWCRDVVDDHLGSVVAGVRAVVPVATAMLWGNVASGLAGALRSLALAGDVPPARCLHEGLSMLDYGPLRGTGRLWVDGGELRFLRRSCCLFYRLEGGGMCGDCPLPARTGAP
jgi:ferric iron reductase protein FhuF